MHPFEASLAEIQSDPERFVDIIISSLVSEFLVLPKGAGFVDYSTFEQGYERLKQATAAFQNVTPDVILPVALQHPISLIVLRTMLGFTPPEWAYITSQRTGAKVKQGFARMLDRQVRMRPTHRCAKMG